MESGTKLCQYLIHYILSVCALMDVEFFNVGIFPIVEKHSFRSSEATQYFFLYQISTRNYIHIIMKFKNIQSPSC